MSNAKEPTIAVLQTGRSPGGARDRHGDYDDMCKTLLGRGSSEADTFAILDGNFPTSLEPYDAFVITGSKFGVYEDHDWIAPLERLIREIYQSGKKLIGICFGHQIIAQALGGVVEKSDQGFGVGVMDYVLVDAQGDKRKVSLYASHQDQVMTAPPGADVIASSDFCKIAGLRYGDRAISLQPHPEFTKDYMMELTAARRGNVVSETVADNAIASLARPVDADVARALLLNFLND